MNDNKPRLYLLKAGFIDNGEAYICPYCTRVEGLLALFPFIRHDIDIFYVDFIKPRGDLAERVGNDLQSCPQLVFLDGDDELSATWSRTASTGVRHITKTDFIFNYFISKYQLPQVHP